MWSGIGKLLAGLLKGLVSGILGFFKRKKLEREASRGRAAKEFLKSEEQAKRIEDIQREQQEKAEKEGVKLNDDDLFDLDK